MGYFEDWGKLKITWHCPFKSDVKRFEGVRGVGPKEEDKKRRRLFLSIYG
jgi:hypothetical protein